MRQKKVIVFGFAALLIVYGVIVFKNWANQPVSVSGKKSVGSDVKGSSINLVDVESDYFVTKYIDSMRPLEKVVSPQKSILDQQRYSSKNTSEDVQLGITVGKVNSASSLSDNSFVKYRQTYPEIYELVKNEPFYPTGSVAYFKRDGTEKGVFWLFGDKFAAVVVSGNDYKNPNFNGSLQAAISNWRWK